MKIAQRFNVGCAGEPPRVPEGRLNLDSHRWCVGIGDFEQPQSGKLNLTVATKIGFHEFTVQSE